MKSVSILSWSLAVSWYFTFLVSNVWAQEERGRHEWGYLRGSESQELLDQAIELKDQMVALTLMPDSQTDEILPTVTLATDGNGHRAIRMEGSFDADSHDFFWFVDSSARTYRILNLTGSTDDDANRIHQVIQGNLTAEEPASVERLKQQLVEVQNRKQARKADFFERSAAAYDHAAAQSYPTCYGGGEAAIGTFDLPTIQLTETYTWSDWWYDGSGSYDTSAGGNCWANPKTLFGTHWYVEACDGELITNSYSAWASTGNLSYNYDFLDDDQYTWVYEEADVYHSHGSPSWSTYHYDWGEASSLIFGFTLLGWAAC